MPTTLIFHYHLFKNAGTSVDRMLSLNFPKTWEQAEFGRPLPGTNSNVEEVAAFLRERPHLNALSSHTALLPPPKLDRDVLPIVFIRHPIDRLKSAYTFERGQIADTQGARLAKEQDFAGYVRQLLENKGHRQARNFQTQRLASFEPVRNGAERERAMRALDALPFVGLVEAYDRSLERLGALLAPHFPEFKAIVTHENRTQGPSDSLEERLAAIEESLPGALYQELRESNADDFAVHDRVKADYSALR